VPEKKGAVALQTLRDISLKRDTVVRGEGGVDHPSVGGGTMATSTIQERKRRRPQDSNLKEKTIEPGKSGNRIRKKGG